MRQTMLEPRRSGNRRVVIGFLLASILLLFLGSWIKPVAATLSPVYVPIESVISGVTSDVGGFFGSLRDLPTLRRQNDDLRKLIAKLTIETASMPTLRREVAALTRMLDFANLNPHLDLQRAYLIGKSQSGLPTFIDVNTGGNRGIRVDNPVLDQNGFLIGKVLSVFPAYSEIGLLTNYAVSIPALDSTTGALGSVEVHNGSVTFDNVEAGRPFRTGDFVTTSALGNEYPIGLLIGQLGDIAGATPNPLNGGALRTAANLNAVDFVQIVRNFGPGALAHYPKKGSPP